MDHFEASAWEDMAIDALAAHLPSLPITIADSDSTEALQTSGVLQSLISVLALPHPPLRLHAVKMLEHVFSPGGETFPVYFDVRPF